MGKILKRTSDDVKNAEKASNDLAYLIGYYDGLRSAVISDPKDVLKKTKTAGVDQAYWKYFSKETQKVLRKMGRSSKVRTMIRVNKVLKFVSMTYFMIVVALAVSWQRNVILPQNLEWLWWLLSWPSVILLFIIADISLLMLSLTKYEMKKLADEGGVKDEETAKGRLKEAVQYHIDKLRTNIEKYKLKPENYKIKLHKTDYKGIKIVKKPGIMRGYYIAIVDVKFKEKMGV